MISTTLIKKLEQLTPDMQKEIEQSIDSLLLKQTTIEQSASSNNTSHLKFGDMKGTVVYIADDFDAPLEDFKDYM